MMNTYLIQSKVHWIKKAKQDFKKLYKLDCNPFTRKIYFYFFKHEHKKYVYKDALKFVYSNADTYTKEPDPRYCELSPQYTPVDVCNFLESTKNPLLPRLIDSDKSFLIFEYVLGTPIDFVTKQEFEFIEEHSRALPLTPFYNSMTYNLIRTTNSIKLVDFKHFEYKINLPFFLYFYNKDNLINRLFIRKYSNLDSILSHLGIDYPVDQTEIFFY
jgi:hypothetical protein